MMKDIAKVIETFHTSLYKIFIDQLAFVYVNNAHTLTFAYIYDITYLLYLWYNCPEKCFLCYEKQERSWLNFFPQPEGPNDNACPVFPCYQSANDYTDQFVHTITCIQQTNLYTALGVQSYVDFMYKLVPCVHGIHVLFN